jgi:hypothetical protein
LIPDSLTKIGKSCFRECPLLSDLLFSHAS